MEKIELGKVVRLHGYLGLMKVNAKFDNDFDLKKIDKMYDENSNCYKVTRISKTKDGALVGLETVDLEKAKTFIGHNLFVERELVSGKMLIEDLKGSSVFFEDGGLVGKITDIQDYGSAEVITLKTPNGKEILFPNVKGLIVEFDYKEKKLVIEQKRFKEVSDAN
jgi:16S rRNA processing protein RimM